MIELVLLIAECLFVILFAFTLSRIFSSIFVYFDLYPNGEKSNNQFKNWTKEEKKNYIDYVKDEGLEEKHLPKVDDRSIPCDDRKFKNGGILSDLKKVSSNYDLVERNKLICDAIKDSGKDDSPIISDMPIKFINWKNPETGIIETITREELELEPEKWINRGFGCYYK